MGTIIPKPVAFGNVWFKWNYHKYERDFLKLCEEHNRIAGLWCRQSGKTETISHYALYKCLTNHKFTVLIIAPSERQSGELFNRARFLTNTTPDIQAYLENSSQTELVFKNGSRLKSLPCGPDGTTIRGFTADIIIIEEAGYVKDSIMNQVIMPMIASKPNGQVIKIGTPKGKNHFWQSCYGKDSSFVLSRVTWVEAVQEGQISQEFIDEQKLNLSDLEFKTEYGAEFIEDSDAFFKQALIEKTVLEYPLIEVVV